MRINRARDVLLDPVARATLDEELARRRGESAPPGAAGNARPGTPATPTANRDRRWRAEWGSDSPWTTPPAGSDSPGPVPPPASPVRPSANRLRHSSRQGRRANPATNPANPALSARQRTAPTPPPPAAKTTPRRRPVNPQAAPSQPVQPPRVQPPGVQPPPVQSQPVQSQPVHLPPAKQQPAQPHPPQSRPTSSPKASPQPTPPPAEKPATAWSLYAVPLDGVSVAALVASLIMCGPLGFILGIIGLARTADEKRRGRWAAVAGIAIGSLTMLLAIGYVMQALSAPAP